MPEYGTFPKIISFFVIISLFGCSTLQPIQAQRGELQDKIRNENILKVSDQVEIITDDGEKHRFRITSIDENEIVGVQKILKTKDATGEGILTTPTEPIEKTYRIPIDSIVSLKTIEFSKGKTTLLAATGTAIVIGFGIFLALFFAMAATP